MTANHRTGEQAIAVLRKEFCTYILPSDSTHCPTFPFCWGGVLDTQRDRSSDIYNLMEISRMLDGSNKNRYGCPRVAASVIILIKSPSIIVAIRPYNIYMCTSGGNIYNKVLLRNWRGMN